MKTKMIIATVVGPIATIGIFILKSMKAIGLKK